ncbi:MAG: RCC1 domain-containing protein [Mycoplasma sp.]
MKTNKKMSKYLIAPIVSLFTLVTIGASVGFSPSRSSTDIGNNVIKTKNIEAYNVLKSDDAKISLGAYHSSAIVDGKLYMWGSNGKGELGIGNTTKQSIPVYVDVDGDENPDNDNVTDVSLGSEYTIAINKNSLYGWGSNFQGQLGLGTYDDKSTPQKVTIPGETPSKVFTGFYHSATMTTSGKLYTWGDKVDGQLGRPVADQRVPGLVELDGTLKSVQIAGSSSSAITSTGLYTWGFNGFGQLGLGHEDDEDRPQKVTELPGEIKQMIFGAAHALTITDKGLYSWGWNDRGQLGQGHKDNVSIPQPVYVEGIGSAPTHIAAGFKHSLVTFGNSLYAWGWNEYGQLGINNTTDQTTPQKVDISEIGVPTQLAAGSEHSFAVTPNGVFSWGKNDYSQLGLGPKVTSNQRTPQIVDHSNSHTDIDILDLISAAGADILKTKIISEVIEGKELSELTELVDLIKANGEELFTKYEDDNVITIKSVDIDKTEASYKDEDSGELFGKIALTFNNDKQGDSWVGYQKINGVEFSPGNIDKQIIISKFKQSDSIRTSELIMKQDDSYTVDNLADELELNGGIDPNPETINKFIDFSKFPKDVKVTKVANIKRFQSLGEITLDITVDRYNAKGTSKEIGIVNEETTYTTEKISGLATVKPSSVVAKSKITAPKGLQPNNFLDTFGSTIRDKTELTKLVNLNSFPEDATFEAEVDVMALNIKSNKVGLTITASAYYDEKGDRGEGAKTFDQVFITIPTVSNITSKPVERKRIPRELKPENFSDFVLKSEEGQESKIVNLENLNKIFELNELFPTISDFGLVEITEDTEFKITNNEISVDGSSITFFLEANQIWNQFGYYEVMPADEWASFKVELEFPGAHSSWVIIGSSIGGSIMLLLIILSLCNKTKLKNIINNKF